MRRHVLKTHSTCIEPLDLVALYACVCVWEKGRRRLCKALICRKFAAPEFGARLSDGPVARLFPSRRPAVVVVVARLHDRSLSNSIPLCRVSRSNQEKLFPFGVSYPPPCGSILLRAFFLVVA